MPLTPEQKLAAEARLRALLSEPSETSNDPRKKLASTRSTQSHDTKTTSQRRREFEERFGYRTPSSELVANIEAAERVVWLPHSYVFFVRQATCRNCRTSVRCLDDANLFLQQRKERRDDSNPYLYTPVKVIEFPNLPRRKILKLVTVPICEACYEGQTCPTNIFSEQEGTESHTETLDQDQFNHKAEVLNVSEMSLGHLRTTLQSENGSLLTFDTHLAESGGSPSETEFGSACGEREFAQTASAEG